MSSCIKRNATDITLQMRHCRFELRSYHLIVGRPPSHTAGDVDGSEMKHRRCYQSCQLFPIVRMEVDRNRPPAGDTLPAPMCARSGRGVLHRGLQPRGFRAGAPAAAGPAGGGAGGTGPPAGPPRPAAPGASTPAPPPPRSCQVCQSVCQSVARMEEEENWGEGGHRRSDFGRTPIVSQSSTQVPGHSIWIMCRSPRYWNSVEISTPARTGVHSVCKHRGTDCKERMGGQIEGQNG